MPPARVCVSGLSRTCCSAGDKASICGAEGSARGSGGGAGTRARAGLRAGAWSYESSHHVAVVRNQRLLLTVKSPHGHAPHH